MGWLERFASEGLYLPVVMIAFGSHIVLQAPFQSVLTPEQFNAAPAWMRWLITSNPERHQRRGGWIIIGFAVFIAVVRIATRS